MKRGADDYDIENARPAQQSKNLSTFETVMTVFDIALKVFSYLYAHEGMTLLLVSKETYQTFYDCMCRCFMWRMNFRNLQPVGIQSLWISGDANILSLFKHDDKLTHLLYDAVPHVNSVNNWPKSLRSMHVRCKHNYVLHVPKHLEKLVLAGKGFHMVGLEHSNVKDLEFIGSKNIYIAEFPRNLERLCFKGDDHFNDVNPSSSILLDNKKLPETIHTLHLEMSKLPILHSYLRHVTLASPTTISLDLSQLLCLETLKLKSDASVTFTGAFLGLLRYLKIICNHSRIPQPPDMLKKLYLSGSFVLPNNIITCNNAEVIDLRYAIFETVITLDCQKSTRLRKCRLPAVVEGVIFSEHAKQNTLKLLGFEEFPLIHWTLSVLERIEIYDRGGIDIDGRIA